MDKSITVAVETLVKHPVYDKQVKQTRKFHAHDAEGLAGVGDVVDLRPCRPLSKTKRFTLDKIVTKRI